MDEIKHKSLAWAVIRGDFDTSSYKGMIIERYVDVPNLLTLGRHTSLQDETPLHCVLEGKAGRVVDFLVPKQPLCCKLSKWGHQHYVLTVLKKDVKDAEKPDVYYRLVTCQDNRTGFLLPEMAL